MTAILKKCNVCGGVKPSAEFSIKRSVPSGRQPTCKKCCKQYREDHKEEIATYQKRYYKDHRARIVAKHKKYHEGNKEKMVAWQKQYNETHKEERMLYFEQYRKNHRSMIAAYQTKYYEKNKKEKLEQQKNYYESNKEKILTRERLYYKRNKQRILARGKLYYETHRDEITTRHKQYSRTAAGRESNRCCHARRERDMGYMPMNKHFEGSHGHHINKDDVVYIPAELHVSVSHDCTTGRGMNEINSLALAWLLNDRHEIVPLAKVVELLRQTVANNAVRKMSKIYCGGAQVVK